MLVEIRGVQFENKGAELMLHAVMQKLSEWDSSNIVTMRPKVGSFRQRAEVGLYQLIWTDANIPFINSIINTLFRLAPNKTVRSLGLTTYPDVNAILDASGFSYSDQWGVERSATMAKLTKQAKKDGKKVILLPQAFGPFEDPQVAKAFLGILENADLIFARDQVSYDYLTKIGGHSSNIKIAPDFTNLVKGRVPEYFDTDVQQTCIIPNVRMIDKNSAELRDSYICFLETCTEILMKAGLRPFILVHDLSDKDIAAHLQQKFGKDLNVVVELNPLNLKGILGNCYLVVSSRFHGLVSALSQGVPCLGTGWSHKYQMLFEDYNCSEYLISPLDTREEIEHRIKSMDEEPTRSHLIARLEVAGSHQKKLVLEMWDEVQKVITNQKNN